VIIFLHKSNGYFRAREFLNSGDSTMSFRDQQKYLDELKKYEKQLTRQESEDYKKFIKRQKDDEDFDSVSMKRLKDLYDKYHKSADFSKYDKFFKKSGDSQ